MSRGDRVALLRRGWRYAEVRVMAANRLVTCGWNFVEKRPADELQR